MFILPVGGLGILGHGALGHPSLEGGVFPSFRIPSSSIIYSGPPAVRGLALTAAVADLQTKGAIELVSSEPGFYSRLFVTPKVTGGWRPVIDLSRLNRFIRLSPFRMETAQSVLQSLRPGDWMVSLDLQDAYLQVPVHPDSRSYLRFCIGPHTYQFRALCFGLSSTPQVFTRVMAPVSSIMNRHGFRILRYLNDWLVLGSSREEIVRARDFLLSLCDEFSVLVNLAKISLNPTQTIDYLGMSFQSTPLRAFPMQARIQKVLSLVSEFASSPAQPLLLWRTLLGVMSSLTPLIPGARLHMRSLQLHLRVACPHLSELALISWTNLATGIFCGGQTPVISSEVCLWSCPTHASCCSQTLPIPVGVPLWGPTTCPACGLRNSRHFTSTIENF